LSCYDAQVWFGTIGQLEIINLSSKEKIKEKERKEMKTKPRTL
jgi:hypothetical protein